MRSTRCRPRRLSNSRRHAGRVRDHPLMEGAEQGVRFGPHQHVRLAVYRAAPPSRHVGSAARPWRSVRPARGHYISDRPSLRAPPSPGTSRRQRDALPAAGAASDSDPFRHKANSSGLASTSSRSRACAKGGPGEPRDAPGPSPSAAAALGGPTPRCRLERVTRLSFTFDPTIGCRVVAVCQDLESAALVAGDGFCSGRGAHRAFGHDYRPHPYRCRRPVRDAHRRHRGTDSCDALTAQSSQRPGPVPGPLMPGRTARPRGNKGVAG